MRYCESRGDDRVRRLLREYFECFPDRLSCHTHGVMQVRTQYHFCSARFEKGRQGALEGFAQSFFNKKVYKHMGLEYFPQELKAVLCADTYWDVRLRRPYAKVFSSLLAFCNQSIPFALDFFVNRNDSFMTHFKSCFSARNGKINKPFASDHGR